MLAEGRDFDFFFSLFLVFLSRAGLFINVWVDLEPEHLNLFIFLGEVPEKRRTQW